MGPNYAPCIVCNRDPANRICSQVWSAFCNEVWELAARHPSNDKRKAKEQGWPRGE